MRKSIVLFFFIFFFAGAQTIKVNIQGDDSGQKLMVNGKPMIVNGMNWDYFPIGTNYNFSLWNQPDDFIKKALDDEMSLLKNMNVNAIRVYTGIPKKWITYIYEKYGIYTMLNHSFGRYGLTIDGVWTPITHYDDAKTRNLLINELKNLVREYKDTPGLLLYLLGNENNYGLFWQGAETEDFPDDEQQKKYVGEKRGRPMYRLMNEVAKMIKQEDNAHPVAISNGDLLFLNIINEECKDVDILGINCYRGVSFTDLFDRVKKEYNKPILLTEFGSDAFNSITHKEDQEAQSYFLKNNWKEIYENASGMGKMGNSLGGFTFQFSDGWWKYKQTEDLDIHNDNASWSNGGYSNDFIKGEDNMNEEWFGICAKGKTEISGHYQLYPRSAYYLLKEIHQFNPYSNVVAQNSLAIPSYFEKINITDAQLKARGDHAALNGESNNLIKISQLRADFNTYNTGGSLITTPKNKLPNFNQYPNQLGFDHMQSYYIGIEGNPGANMRAQVNFNITGNVAENPIDQIFYENRARVIEVVNQDGTTTSMRDFNRLQVYSASYKWNHKKFDLNGFYRTGHYHWGYEGDIFGLYPEANYGANIDIYNGEAPFGFEFTGKKEIEGLKIAFGPELWWGANPAFLVKYSRNLGKLKLTGVFHEDLDQRGDSQSSFAVPQPKTRRATLALQRKIGKFDIDLGGIWAGQPLNGRDFQLYREGNIYQDQINSDDNWGGKTKFTYTGGRFNWYAQGSVMGLVANGGWDQTQTFTGWRLKDSGSGNQYNFLTGFTYRIGNFEIAPNFLWQEPIEGPVPATAPAPGRPRNILTDPFVVRANRKQTAGEILFTYDPTPATWMYAWDSDRIEDAPFAFSAGFVYRHLPTVQDAAIGIFGDGRTLFAFPGSAPAADLWEANLRLVSKVNHQFGLVAQFYGGTAQANGSDTRTVERLGMEVKTIYKKMRLISAFRLNDWGPYDYHRDYNLTFPMQLIGDLSLEIGKPDWLLLPGTRIGIRGTYRTLNQYSPRYNPTQKYEGGSWVPDPFALGFPNGNEWEIRTYIQINIGK